MVVEQSQTIIRGYELRERIGEGGFGAVHRAYQSVVDREVAIKVILPQYANNPGFVRSFEAEARLVARLEHPFIVPLFDYWREPDGAYLVMRFFPCGSLRRLLKERGALSADRVAEILAQLAGAVDTAHSHHIIHRDIKPENVLMDDEGNAYLADFGIAQRVEKGEPGSNGDRSFSGTLAYAAPELLNHGSATRQSDIYSLGYVAYELLTGKHAFAEESPVLLLMSIMERELPAISGVPEAVLPVLRRATSKVPEERYPSARAFARDFQQALNQQAAVTIPDTELSAVSDIVNPYKGLRPFDEGDAADFFGRSALLDQLLDDLRRDKRWNNFLAIVGPSGSGKSSAVHAGLLPALRAGKVPGSESWYILPITPGAHPVQQLKTALLSIAIDPMDTLSGRLQSGPDGLLRALDEVLQIKHDVLLFIDQFEEVFTQVDDEQERQHFLELLYAAVSAPGSRLRLIITLRADFYDKPLLYENFAALIQARTEVVLPLNAEELEQAITGPARRAGLKVDPELVAAIVTDVRQEPGALPLLQYALTEIFEQREGNRLTLAAYQKSGGVLGALASRAEEVYNSLPLSQQEVAQQLFLRLVVPGEGTDDARRRARYSELTALKITRDSLQAVLDAFGKYRLLTFDRDSETREPTIEVAHEALIREWSRLRGWLDSNRNDIRLQRMLAAAAHDWRNARQDKSYLLSGSRLVQFEEWAKTAPLALSHEEHAYLAASTAEDQRQRAAEAQRHANELILVRRSRRRLQVIVGILVLASLLGIGLTVQVYRQSQAASLERDRAERQATEANSLRLGTLAQQAFSKGDTVTALSLAVDAASIENPPVEVMDSLINIAYAPGLRRVTQVTNQPITAVVISPDESMALVASGHTAWTGGIGGGQPPAGGLPAGGPPPPAGTPPNAGSDSDSNYSLALWDLKTGKVIYHLQDKSASFSDLVFVPGDTLRAVSAAVDGRVMLWDVAAGKPIDQFSVPPADKITLSLSQDNQRLLIIGGMKSGEISQTYQILWDVAARQTIRRVTPHDANLWTGHINPNGKTAVSAYRSGLQIVWDIETGQELRRYDPGAERIKIEFYGTDISPDQATGALNIGEPDVLLWNIDSGRLLGTVSAGTVMPFRAVFTADGSELLTVTRDGILRLWDVKKRSMIQEVIGRNVAFESAALSKDGKFAVIGSSSGSLYYWDLEPTRVRELQRFGQAETKQAAFISHGTQVLAFETLGYIVGGGSQLSVWDLKTGKLVRTFGQNQHIYMPRLLAVSQDERLALTATIADVPGVPRKPGLNDSVILWNIETGEKLWQLETDTNVSGMMFDPLSGKDGRPYTAVIAQGSKLALWQVDSGKLLRIFEGSNGSTRRHCLQSRRKNACLLRA
jgi:serine/threonine protein kinase/WD40 repeat protein